MDRKIKTRQVHKDIKVLDKTVTVTDHVKHSYVRTKETVMQSTEKSRVILSIARFHPSTMTVCFVLTCMVCHRNHLI